MYQLEHVHQVIDHSIVMINIDLTRGYNSVVKFGGYDVLALKEELAIFKIESDNGWSIPVIKVYIGSQQNPNSDIPYSEIIFSPD